MPVPDLLHEGQWLPFGNWDGAKDNGAWCGQRLADRLNERLAEQLHLPNLINDAHTVPGAAAGTGLRTEGIVTGTAEPCDLDPEGPTLTTHQRPQQGSWVSARGTVSTCTRHRSVCNAHRKGSLGLHLPASEFLSKSVFFQKAQW